MFTESFYHEYHPSYDISDFDIIETDGNICLIWNDNQDRKAQSLPLTTREELLNYRGTNRYALILWDIENKVRLCLYPLYYYRGKSIDGFSLEKAFFYRFTDIEKKLFQ